MIRVASNRSALLVGPINAVGWPPIVATIAQAWRELRNGFADTYRPELHYMRGPGPKWREKHGAPIMLVGARPGVLAVNRIRPTE
jgi:hypothetical protein